MSAVSERVQTGMPFTKRDFWRGAWASWATFMILLTVTLLIAGLTQTGTEWGPTLSLTVAFLAYGLPIGGIVAVIVMFVSSPIAWILGRLLSRFSHPIVHVSAFAGLGAAVGATILTLYSHSMEFVEISLFTDPWALAVMAACSVSVACGWLWAHRRSLRETEHRRKDV